MKQHHLIFEGLYNFAYLAKSNHSLKNKIGILLIWLKIYLKSKILDKFLKLKTENIFGYKINAFDYETIKIFFEEIFYKNEYLFDSKNKKPIIFDCGANIGFATIFFKWLYPESQIYTFEPDKKTFELLKKNVSQNKLKNVHLFNTALSNKTGKIDFFIDTKWPGSWAMSTKYERMPKDKIIVDCISLSSLIEDEKIKQIDYIKMDIEGSENEVISDLNNNNQLKKVIKLVIEYHHKISKNKSNLSQFLKIFEDNGFEYQVDARCIPLNSENKFQDVLLRIYKSHT